MSACPDDDTIAAFAAAQLAPALRSKVELHLAECSSCHDLLGELARIDAAAPAVTHTVSDDFRTATTAPGREGGAPEPLAAMLPGDKLDGYVLLRRLDAGAMGEVWLADDPELHRQVAVKVLHGTYARRDPGADGILRREARSLAQLSHPNVVTVHGVKESGGRDYIAMEYVAGVTLRTWLATGHPTLNERLAVMIQAGLGLAAAHRAGVVHRDFKPSNVLVGQDGRVRVGDFGLARLRRVDPASASTPGEISPQTSVAGTPVYMAPEQLRGGAATDLGDQYSFAVSLYEAVYGVRPWTGSDPEQLAAAIERDPPALPAKRVRVPGWLRALVLRGLSADPARRFPSMDALVAALEAGLRRRRRALVAAAMVAVAVVSVAVAIPIARQAAVAEACDGEAELLARVWSPTRATAIRGRLERLAGRFGVEQWDRAAPIFHDYARRWIAMRRETCEATRVRHVQSDSLFDRRMYCLDRRLAQLGSLTGSLEQLEEKKLVPRLVEVANGLPSLDACADTRWLSDAPMPPLAIRSNVDEAFAALDAARTLGIQGRYKEALAGYRALDARARELAFAPLVADLAFETAYAADRVGDFAFAETEYARVSDLAAGLHRIDRVFELQAHTMRMEAFHQKFERALGRAAALKSLAGLSADPLHPSMYHEHLATLYDKQGKYAESVKEYREALALLPPGTPPGEREASARVGLALVLMDLGQLDAAEPELMRALAIREQVYGAQHPLVSKTLSNIGNLHWHRAEYAKALEKWQRALAILDAISNGDDPELAIVLGNVAIAQHGTGDFAGALASFDRAMALRIRFFGPEHHEVAAILANKGELLTAQRRYDEAQALVRQAIAIREKAQGKDHPDLVRTYMQLGGQLVAQGAGTTGASSREAYSAALVPLSHAFTLGTAKLGPRHHLLGQMLIHRARAQLALGNLAAARTDGELALSIMVEKYSIEIDEMLPLLSVVAELRLHDGKAAQVVELIEPGMKKRDVLKDGEAGTAAFALARAYWQVGRRDEAVAMARRALAVFDAKPEPEVTAVAQKTREWLGRFARSSLAR